MIDSTTSLPLAGVEVIVDGAPLGVTTDLMGNFSADVPAGDHLFTFKRSCYYSQSIGPKAVEAAGELALRDARLAPEKTDEEVVMLETLEVQGECHGSAVSPRC